MDKQLLCCLLSDTHAHLLFPESVQSRKGKESFLTHSPSLMLIHADMNRFTHTRKNVHSIASERMEGSQRDRHGNPAERDTHKKRTKECVKWHKKKKKKGNLSY